MIFFYSKYI